MFWRCGWGFITMQRSEATRYGAALVAAGVLADAAPGAHEGKAQRRLHGTATIRGHWAATGHPAIIGCEHVARALIVGGYDVGAIRSCRHTPQTAHDRIEIRGPGIVRVAVAELVTDDEVNEAIAALTMPAPAKRAPARKRLAACPHCGGSLVEAVAA